MRSPTHQLPKKAREFLMDWRAMGSRAGGDLHTSNDYPRVLQARGLLERRGAGYFGHTHCITMTPKGEALGMTMLVERLLVRPFEVSHE